MDLPPNLQQANVTVTTSVTPNTATTGTLVAAPGAQTRLRLWGFQAVPRDTAQAVANWRAFSANGVGGATLLGCSGSNFASQPLSWLPGGWALSTNTILGYAVSSALASMVMIVAVFYTTESA